ncbi:hypothetical protein [Amaricoccus macauensis]|uniref:hypothetical protein n=1 Tax=Amaricoccus macauensis TaxID=57001 RepID=UPI003C7D3137
MTPFPARRPLLLGGLLLPLCAVATPIFAEGPRSAIPWLSESITAPPVEPDSPGETLGPLQTETITVTPLDGTEPDAIGILPSETTGFARSLWGPTDLETARDLIETTRSGGVPETRALFLRLLLAEAEPPMGDDDRASLLTARIDRLLREGALEQADALILFATPTEAELFRRWFDIGLLTDNAEPACEALRRNPSLSPTLPARVFCLARGGDWNAAEITLTLGRQIGSISPEQEEMLARFLDPEIFESEPPPPVPDPLTPLDFLMREAVGLPRPPGQLPLAFLHYDLGEHTPMRMRIAAAERLLRAGAIASPPLFAAYRAGEPAASGGVWDRAAAIQDLDKALEDPTGEGLAASLADADNRLADVGFRVALAREYAPAFMEISRDTLTGTARSRIFELLLLAGETEAATPFRPDQLGPKAELAASLAAPEEGNALPDPKGDPMATAILEAFDPESPADIAATGFGDALDEGRQGEAILRSIDLLADGIQTSPQSLTLALSTLRAAGQETAARHIAIETLLGDAGSVND